MTSQRCQCSVGWCESTPPKHTHSQQGNCASPVLKPRKVAGLDNTPVHQISAGTSHSVAWTAIPTDRKVCRNMWLIVLVIILNSNSRNKKVPPPSLREAELWFWPWLGVVCVAVEFLKLLNLCYSCIIVYFAGLKGSSTPAQGIYCLSVGPSVSALYFLWSCVFV